MKDRLIKNLSKGYRQRVGLAQAILGDPEVIILDEPTVGLDPRQIIEIRDLIRSLGQKHTVILSSHILSEVSAICDQIMIISHGKLVASDTPEGLQNLMHDSEQLYLEVKGSWEEVSTALSTISTIESVENQGKEVDNSAGDSVKIRVLAKENADIREEVFYCLAEHKLPILSMQQRSKSLEDIFLELTDSEAQEESNSSQEGNDTAQEGDKASGGNKKRMGIRMGKKKKDTDEKEEK